MPATETAAKKAAKKAAARPTSLAALREKMTKVYGEGRIVRRENVIAYDVIPTGSLSLDVALRVGGWVRGRIHEIVGPEGVGKTTTIICSMVEAQHKYPDLAVGYIDMEQTFDYEWAEKLGLDTSASRWLHVYPDDSEDVSDQIREMADTGLFSMITVDSIGGMESKQAFEKDAGETVMGRNAQVITRMVKHSAVLCRRNNVAVILVNQFRANLSNPQGGDQSAGPKAMRYATTTKVDLRRTSGDALKVKFPDDKEPQIVGIQVRARVSRNKVAAPGKVGEFYIINQHTTQYGPVGIDQADEALTIGLLTEVIDAQGGGYYAFPWTKDPKERIRGRESVLAWMRENPDKALEVRDLAVAKMADDVIAETQVVFDAKTGEVQ